MTGRKALFVGIALGVLIMLSMRTQCVSSGVNFPAEGV